MIGMRVVKADDVEALISCISLDSDKIQWRDTVAVARRILPGIRARNCGNNCVYGISEMAEQRAAALVGKSILSVLLKRGVACGIDFQNQFLFTME